MSSTVLVYGGAGALGASTVQYFKEQGWTAISVDVRSNADASSNVLVDANASVAEQAKHVVEQLETTLGDTRLDALLCVAGGWAGGRIDKLESLSNAELMWKQSVNSSLVAGHIASRYLKPNGLLVLTGAQAAKEGTSMVGYGLAKAAVHQLTASLASDASGLPSGARVAAILPVTLDTPGNRAGMPNADFSAWTPLNDINKKLFAWATHKEPVDNGKLVSVVTQNGETRFD
ncbi:hypothetical protein SYNPS1DRAFT_24074 [Syncephalis pseudoplumigaleata]|uniref:Dihydropteridine reductase n=1 Tax=Syncephalis pseudoplumigaleata TaxID=1712513 RepID=A0A4P9YV20_9FUNG|nr:hypothetical protein SYNPS1DRAFT_24074 [Syncephalis pseudoplumigaleata]|eukprot:RKP23846.1 hypothetical protein SYNPS1DRAFT_24074 [Syncephalis pseudoplumigaleata]